MKNNIKEQPEVTAITPDCAGIKSHRQKYCAHRFDNNIIPQNYLNIKSKISLLKVSRL